MALKSILAVGAGGAIGAVLRYIISLIPFEGDFPTGTFLVNVLGAFALGFISGLVIDKDVSREAELFLKTGMCGGFTTFSTFSLEAITLIQGGKVIMGIVYIILSLAGSLAGVFFGLTLGKAIG